MHKTILTFIICLLSLHGAKSQTLEELFLTMPKELLPTLNQSDRLDLIDMYKAGAASRTNDLLNQVSSLTVFDKDILRLETGGNALELALLPMINDSYILLMIKTTCAPVCDSELRFYTLQWKRLDSRFFFNPVGKEWFMVQEAVFANPIAENTLLSLDIEFMKYSYNTEKKLLVQEYLTPEYLDQEQKEKVNKLLKRENKTYQWNGAHFE